MIPQFDVQYGFRDFLVALGALRAENLGGDFRLPGFEGSDVQFLPTRRGREALYLLLKSLDLPPLAKIGLPLYTCTVVVQTVAAAGLTPVFLDADAETFGLSLSDLQAKADGLDGLILVHSFGYPADYQRVRSILENKPIIEDCAHGVGSKYCGQPLGSLGYGSLFAFGLFKPFSTSTGGCIVTKDGALAERLRSAIKAAPCETTRQELEQAFDSLRLGLAFRRPAYHLLSHLFERPREPDAGGALPKRIVSEFLMMRRTDRSVLMARLRTWSLQRNGDFWKQVRDHVPAGWWVPPEPHYGEWNHFLLPIRAPNPKAGARAVTRLRAQGVAAAQLYRNSASTARLFGYTGDCPEAELLAESVIVFPCYPSLSLTDRRKLLRCLVDLGELG